MKTIKTIIAIILLTITSSSFAQINATRKLERSIVKPGEGKGGESLSNIPSCFCCGNFYNLPKPVINGPKEIICGNEAKFTAVACEGAQVIWTVSPAISGSTQTSTSFTVPANATSGNYTLNYQVGCNREKFVSTQFQFTILNEVNCVPDFLVTVTQLPNGNVNISTNPSLQTPGKEHWWGIQYNGTYPSCDPQSPILFSSLGSSWGGYINNSGVLTPYLGSGITIVNGYGISYSGFQNNKCVKITHYVKCCGQMIRQTAYFSFGTSNARLANSDKPIELKPQIIMSAPEIVN
jgi:hypothetical protein